MILWLIKIKIDEQPVKDRFKYFKVKVINIP